MSLTPTPEETREHSIESWMLTIVRDGGVARRDDLHVDRIDKAWKPPDCWVRSGLDAFRMASELRDRHQLPLIVALGFSLQSGDYPTGIDFRNPEELSEKLDWSPPSLYLFEPGKTPRSRHDRRCDS